MIYVAIVDDHPLVRAGIQAVISRQSDITVTGLYGEGHQFFLAARTTPQLDVVLLDVTMPRSDGLEILKRLRTWRQPPKVLILSMHPERTHARLAMDAGAHGYLNKNVDDATILTAIRTIAWGGTYLSIDAHAGLATPAPSTLPNALDTLSIQEQRVYTLLRQGLTIKEIARDLDINRKTVTTYKARLMQKLGARSIVDIFRFGELSGNLEAAKTR